MDLVCPDANNFSRKHPRVSISQQCDEMFFKQTLWNNSRKDL